MGWWQRWKASDEHARKAHGGYMPKGQWETGAPLPPVVAVASPQTPPPARGRPQSTVKLTREYGFADLTPDESGATVLAMAMLFAGQEFRSLAGMTATKTRVWLDTDRVVVELEAVL